MASAESFALGSEPREEAADLEIPEVDGALLREILEELDKDDVAMGGGGCGGAEHALQPPEVRRPSAVSEAPRSEQDGVPVQDLGWLEDVTPPSEEARMGWYGDEMAGTVEFHYVVEDGGNWEFYDEIASEELGYGCLWEST